ncbi:hypothetical protein FRC12_021011 [Ceratobasidium sp. 428]|nr:hypothetical protein FRC12_021011 [Ceratobasidium sp. 428]
MQFPLSFASALMVLATAVSVSAAPSAGTYVVSQPGFTGGLLSLYRKDDTAVIASRDEFKKQPKGAQEWIVESSSGDNTISLKNVKYGTYLGYDFAQLGAPVKGSNKPTSFTLVPSDDKKGYFITTTERVNGATLYVDEGVDVKFGPPNVLLGEKRSWSQPWTFELLASSPKPEPAVKPTPTVKPTGCGKPSPSPAWAWPSD